MQTFPYTPSFVPVSTRRPRVLATKFGDGYEQRGADGLHADLQSWQLQFEHVPTREADQIEGFFVGNQTAIRPFRWSAPRPLSDYEARTWAAQVTNDNNWTSVAWNGALFVAVSSTGTGNRVMTSPDGKTWTLRTPAADIGWTSVVWNGSVFCAVAASAVADDVMTSPDGLTWTSRTGAATNGWQQVVWAAALGLFVAVSSTGTGNRVMTSPDGIAWTSRTSAADYSWISVTYSPELQLLVAVADSTGLGNRVMTSPDGIAWTLRTTPADLLWRAVTWNGSIFCAVSGGTAGVMTSLDGVVWTQGTMPNTNTSRCIAWNGVVFAVGQINAGVANRVATSRDGFTWTAGEGIPDNNWTGICAAGATFVAVSASGAANRAMVTVPTPTAFLCRSWTRQVVSPVTDRLVATFEEVADPA